jgi:hypothetical protein
MAWTQAQLDAINAAIAAGTKAVDYGDRRIVYHSLDEMLKAKRVIEEDIAAQAGTGRSRVTYGRFSRG